MFVLAGPPPPRPGEVRWMTEDTCLDARDAADSKENQGFIACDGSLGDSGRQKYSILLIAGVRPTSYHCCPRHA